MTSVVDRRAFARGALAVLVTPLAVDAQQPIKVPRIGILRSGTAPDPFVARSGKGFASSAT